MEKVDRLFETWDKPSSPGCALGIIQDGTLIYAHGYGMANLEHNIPITSKSVFRIGSTSKQFTAVCMALLEEEGELSLDDSLRKFLPQMPEYAEEITIRHLIHHTSGLRDYLTLAEIAGIRDDDYFTDAEVVDLLARQKELNFKTGEEHLYSNTGYFLLSQIVKKASGKSLREYAEEKIFQPLGMTNTHFHDDHTRIVKNRASGYAPKKGGGFVISMTTLPMTGDGGVFTSVEDLFLWDQNFYDNRLGESGQGLIGKIQTPGVLNSGENLDYAFGLGIGEHKGLTMVSHGGSFVGFRADMIRFPEQRLSVICLANLSTFDSSGMARRIADIYLADLIKDRGGDKTKPGPEKPKFIKLSEVEPKLEELKVYVGKYYSEEVDTAYFLRFKNGKLFMRHENPHRSYPKAALKPMFKDRFQVERWKLNFIRDEDEEIVGFKVNAGRVQNIFFEKQ
ncbi:MAG: serine hydrolase [Candidatus Aminicenantes bacterium]|nr:serine hydrolase [Candidatus Aminicenantes bacterium]